MDGDNEFWTSHVEACRRDGGAASVYARRHGLTLASLYYWRRKLTPAAEASEGGRVAAKFVALRVVAAATAATDGPCTLVLGSGLHLEMAALPSPAWLLALDQAHAHAHARAGAR
ncbi:IS66 family insertion sequence element accessory protein TnpA [Rugamonas violacea]|uniref:IS66 family insertion sequence element accessory protein TnpA n=1 Tax=Rugamonas sp. CCM 8940 TaxID=2765359 RepID=UPI00366EF911